MMDAGEPWKEKQIFIRLFLNIAFGVANRNSHVRMWEKVGDGPWRGLCFAFLQTQTVVILFVSICDSFIVQLCAGRQRLEGLSASKLADWTSLCDSLICVDPTPWISPAVLCVSIGSENGIVISPFISFPQGTDFTGSSLHLPVPSCMWLRSGNSSADFYDLLAKTSFQSLMGGFSSRILWMEKFYFCLSLG